VALEFWLMTFWDSISQVILSQDTNNVHSVGKLVNFLYHFLTMLGKFFWETFFNKFPGIRENVKIVNLLFCRSNNFNFQGQKVWHLAVKKFQEIELDGLKKSTRIFILNIFNNKIQLKSSSNIPLKSIPQQNPHNIKFVIKSHPNSCNPFFNYIFSIVYLHRNTRE
jgi:hypothetical protein